MHCTVKTGNPVKLATDCLVLGVFTGRILTPSGVAIDEASAGSLRRALARSAVDGAIGKTVMFYHLAGIAAERVLLVGLGEAEKLDAAAFRKAAGGAAKALAADQVKEALFTLTADAAGPSPHAKARDLVLAVDDASYRFDRLKSKSAQPRVPVERLVMLAAGRGAMADLKQGVAHGEAIAGGIQLAKDLGNLPGNICTPAYLADEARKLATLPKLEVQVLEQKDMEGLGMGALLSVARGSRQPPKLIVMHYRGGDAEAAPLVLVGKGLTFDAGGISLKPPADMDQMKFDMCGGASVIGALAACARLGLPLNVVGVVPSSENLPDGNANKPGDIVTSMSGQTIEILNTDAEGRLILCDALTYCERFEPAAVVDVATLTGACVIALGHHPSGLFANDDALAAELLAAGEDTGDRAWRLPLWEDYQEAMDSNFADMANIGGKSAGAVIGACFLARYTRSFKWAHLDIAGTAWNTGKEKGSTGRPVRLLTQWLVHRAATGA
ncbi:MAG: leucyl aminopeptidase [Gammaproteobacteria bacterium]|jgi:leucyl aminopeptidase|nr:leucyl aminopeptidase [Gammaproteobacteria bacterium]